jgi:hypothetical protein
MFLLAEPVDDPVADEADQEKASRSGQGRSAARLCIPPRPAKYRGRPGTRKAGCRQDLCRLLVDGGHAELGQKLVGLLLLTERLVEQLDGILQP